MPFKDNEKINNLTFIRYIPTCERVSRHKNSEFLCDCGKLIIADSYRVANGTTKKCDTCSGRCGQTSHPLYGIWHAMKERCTQDYNKAYPNYGGRGISMCDDWMNNPIHMIEYCEDNGWYKGCEIDRIDNDGNYEPGNVRFVTAKQNAMNRRGRKTNKSGYKGVSIKLNRFRALIVHNGKNIHIGSFKDAETAARAYDAKAKELFGEYAYLNFKDTPT